MPDTSTLLILTGITITILIVLYHLTTITITKAKKTQRQLKTHGPKYVLIERRLALKTAITLFTAGLIYQYFPRSIIDETTGTKLDPTNITNDIVSSPEPPERIGTHTANNRYFDRLIFYDNGTADVYFHGKHTFEHFGITHSKFTLKQDAYARWNTPAVTGPVTVPMGNVIQRNGPYSSNEFVVGSTDRNKWIPNSSIEIEAPSEWYPDNKDTNTN